MTITSHDDVPGVIFLEGEITPIDGTPCFSPSWGVQWNPSREVIIGILAVIGSVEDIGYLELNLELRMKFDVPIAQGNLNI
jgi:hypothetical protein